MTFTRELKDKAKTAKTAKELAEMAKAEGIDMTADEAEKAFAKLQKSGELADSELDNVAGGGCGGKGPSGDTPKYKVGDKVYYFVNRRGLNGMMIPQKVDAVVLEVLDKKYGYFYYKVTGDYTKSEQDLSK